MASLHIESQNKTEGNHMELMLFKPVLNEFYLRLSKNHTIIDIIEQTSFVKVSLIQREENFTFAGMML